MAENGRDNFSRQVALVILGALIGIVPTLIITGIQLRHETNQYLLTKRIDALRDYAAAINDSVNVIAKCDHMDQVLQIMIDDPKPEREGAELISANNELIFEYEKSVAALRTQTIVMESVFHVSLHVPQFPGPPQFEQAPVSGSTLAVRKQVVKNAERERKIVHDMEMTYIKQMDSYQHLLDLFAKRLY
ncbi:MAG TPA: hypothetical protein VKS20_01430 [Candidatus Acidoferrales bacterium]|nr:hypothetical protein [Candidatus Acidoferrales bacterium]